MREPIFWNRLGNLQQVQNSVIGPNIDWRGSSTYAAGKFGNGSYSDANADSLEGSESVFDPNKFAVEMWVKADYNIVDGKPQDSERHCLWQWRIDDDDLVECEFDNSNGLRFLFVVDGNFTSVFATTGINMTAGNLYHLGFVFNRLGIQGSSDTMRMYLDNVKVFNSTTAVGDQVLSSGDFIFLVLQFPVGNYANGFDGLVDNVKIYDYDKIDFSDRFDERGGLNDQEIIL